MRLLVFGGSFNPIHIGHLILAEEARAVFGYTHVALVPAAGRPLKEIVSDPGPQARLEMTRAAAAGDDTLIVWDGEVRRGGLSFTIDTIRELVRSFALEEKPGLLIGDDLLDEFPRWKEAESLTRETRIICAHRESPEKKEFPFDHAYLGNLLIPISSRLVRQRIIQGRPYRRLVPESVWRIISKEGFYRDE